MRHSFIPMQSIIKIFIAGSEGGNAFPFGNRVQIFGYRRKIMKENQFFAMMSRMKYINRWGLMRNTYNENICEHSLQVAMIAHALGVIGNTYLIRISIQTVLP